MCTRVSCSLISSLGEEKAERVGPGNEAGLPSYFYLCTCTHPFIWYRVTLVYW